MRLTCSDAFIHIIAFIWPFVKQFILLRIKCWNLQLSSWTQNVQRNLGKNERNIKVTNRCWPFFIRYINIGCVHVTSLAIQMVLIWWRIWLLSDYKPCPKSSMDNNEFSAKTFTTSLTWSSFGCTTVWRWNLKPFFYTKPQFLALLWFCLHTIVFRSTIHMPLFPLRFVDGSIFHSVLEDRKKNRQPLLIYDPFNLEFFRPASGLMHWQ